MAAAGFEGGDAGASNTNIIECSALRRGGFVMLKSRPCKIIEISSSQTGKHGHSKCHIAGTDLFTGNRIEDLYTSTDKVEVPVVKQNEYHVLELSDDGYMTLISYKGEVREDLKTPEGEMGVQMRAELEQLRTVTCVVTTACGEEQVTSVRSISGEE